MRPGTHRIVHISTVHSALDPRIRLKELRAVVEAGMEACLITADPDGRDVDDGVVVRPVSRRHAGRVCRRFVLAPLAVFRALSTPAAVYHIHDPELLPWAWLLLLRHVKVVYDVHEDYSLAIGERPYIPRAVRKPARAIVAAVERALTIPFELVIAESCYRTRFAGAQVVLNYPEHDLLGAGPSVNVASNSVLYTGNVTVERGALQLARLAAASEEIRVSAIGKCSPDTARRMREVAGGSVSRLRIVGEGRYVPFEEIRSYYELSEWIAGVVLIPDSPHYRNKHLTKFFEYMAAGLPVIASDVPEWRRLIVGNEVGLCVNPEDPDAVAGAVRWLRRNPDAALAMSERGRTLVRSRYSWHYESRRLISFYEHIISK